MRNPWRRASRSRSIPRFTRSSRAPGLRSIGSCVVSPMEFSAAIPPSPGSRRRTFPSPRTSTPAAPWPRPSSGGASTSSSERAAGSPSSSTTATSRRASARSGRRGPWAPRAAIPTAMLARASVMRSGAPGTSTPTAPAARHGSPSSPIPRIARSSGSPTSSAARRPPWAGAGTWWGPRTSPWTTASLRPTGSRWTSSCASTRPSISTSCPRRPRCSRPRGMGSSSG